MCAGYMMLSPFHTLSHLVLEAKPIAKVILFILFCRLGN